LNTEVTVARRHPRVRKALIVVLVLLIVVIIALAAISAMTQPYDRTQTTYKNFDVSQNDDLDAVADRLEEDGFIRSSSRFELLAKISAAKNFRPGTYYLSPSMDSLSIMRTLQRGLTTAKGFQIPAGYTVDQIAAALDRDGLADRDAFLEAASSPALADIEILEDPTGELSGTDLVEGFFLPGEYTLSSGADESMMVIMMIDAFTNFYNEEYLARTDELGITPREVLIIASMIEKETSVDKERAQISAVLHNRYNLELDSRDDLPKVPLCSPSEESIIAALYPEEDEYTHYVLSSKLDGTHVFTSDDAEYERLLAEYNAAVEAKESAKAADKADTGEDGGDN
jgi:UPF0755 protein